MNKMNEILEVLMNRDNMTKKEAIELIKEARKQLNIYLEEGDLESAENICEEFFGLEYDYIFDLI